MEKEQSKEMIVDNMINEIDERSKISVDLRVEYQFKDQYFGLNGDTILI